MIDSSVESNSSYLMEVSLGRRVSFAQAVVIQDLMPLSLKLSNRLQPLLNLQASSFSQSLLKSVVMR
jgi:hypothetical protein